MSGLYKRPPSAFWHYDIMVQGKRKRISTKRTKKSEAEAVRAEALRSALNIEQFGQLPELTLREVMFDHYLPSRVNRASYQSLKYYCELLCGDRKDANGVQIQGLGRGGDMKFHELTKAMIQQYRNRRMAQGMSDQSIDHEVKSLVTAYRMVSSSCRVSPGLEFPMMRPKGKPRPLAEGEVQALLQALDPNRPIVGRKGTTYLMRPSAKGQQQRVDNYDLVVMLLDTGARFGEIAKLTWDMVDTADFKWINIYRSKVGKEGLLSTTNRMQDLLRRRLSDRDASNYVFPGWGYVYRNEDAPKYCTRAIRNAMGKVGINHPAKIERFGRRDLRSLRDTFATNLRRKGMSLDRLQLLLGHASPQMTAKYADYEVSAASDEAVAILNGMA